jgi:GTP-binding protein EngB required for normal cell division
MTKIVILIQLIIIVLIYSSCCINEVNCDADITITVPLFPNQNISFGINLPKWETLFGSKDVNNDKIKKMQEAVDKYKLIVKDVMTQSLRRNYLVVGKGRVGKTSMIKQLFNPFHLVSDGSIYLETKEASAYPMTYKLEDIDYNFNIVDTPGFFEQTGKKDQARTMNHLASLIVGCVYEEITKIHGILFVISLDSGISEQDIETLELIVNLFKGASNKIKLIITKSQDKDATWEDNKRKELKEHGKLSKLINTDNIYFHGAIEYNTIKNGYLPSYEYQMPRTLELRGALIKSFIKDDDYFSLDVVAPGNSRMKLFMLKARRDVLVGSGKEEFKSDIELLDKEISGLKIVVQGDNKRILAEKMEKLKAEMDEL